MTDRESENAPASRIPDWAPWAVLGLLLGFGCVGGLGLIPLPVLEKSAHAAHAAAPSGSPAATAAAAPNSSTAGTSSRDTLKIEASHLVVTYQGTPLGKRKGITRGLEEARQRAEAARARALKGEDFALLAVEYSDEPGAAESKGNLGAFRYKDAVKPFAEVAFALKPGEVSAVTLTAFGFHVIKRTK